MDSPAPPPPPATSRGGSGGGGLAGDINPSILLIIVILSVIFFVSGLLHLLVRLLLKPSARAADELETTTALQGQLQQLFHLHDSGVDQFFIDTLPVFVYKAIIGVKDPFDCAVCLCEFEPDDKLRLLPKCSHAFHIDCIDTWLLSHSTCPLCRSSLVSDLPPAVCHGGAAALLILESGGESSAEAAGVRDAEEESSASPAEASEASSAAAAVPPLKVVRVKLGKFRNLDGGGGAAGGEGSSAGSGNLDQRRCFSMGSFEYVMDERLRLKVAIEPPAVKPPAANPVRRLAMSECGWSSRREDFKGIEQLGGATLASNPQRAESFSVSKIWRRLRKEKETATTAAAAEARPRTVSFRLPPPHPEVAEEDKTNPGGSSRRSSDCGGGAAPWWDKGGSEFEFDVESGSCDGGGAAVSRAGETPSFAWRTMLWLVGRNHKVVNHV